jgi:hypothetical protein
MLKVCDDKKNQIAAALANEVEMQSENAKQPSESTGNSNTFSGQISRSSARRQGIVIQSADNIWNVPEMIQMRSEFIRFSGYSFDERVQTTSVESRSMCDLLLDKSIMSLFFCTITTAICFSGFEPIIAIHLEV